MLMALTCVSLVSLDLWQCWVGYEDRLRAAKTDTANLAQSIASNVHDAFTIADTVLLDLRERIASDGTGLVAVARLEQVMRTHIAGQDLIRGFFLIDEHGAWLANSVPGTSHALNYADRDYFRHHRDVDDEHVLIGPPIRSKTSDGWMVTITHRLNHPDGSFAGTVGATIATEVFQSVFERFDIGRYGVISMTNDRALVLGRQPFAEDNVGRDITSSPIFLKFVDASEAKSFEYVALIDGVTRIGSFNRVPGFGLIVIVSRERDEVLAAWWRQTEIHLTWMAFALLACATLAWRRVMSLRRSAQTEALYRLLADNSSDAIICLGRDGRRRYVSPSFSAMTGWTMAELLEKSMIEMVNPEDRPVAAAAFKDLMAGLAPVVATYRYLRCDGTTLWIELLARPTADPLGGLPVFVGNIRDISRQKAAEDQLAATIAELAAIALTDPLTGIANRRHFDETLLKEWKRAMRDGIPLALLLIDADHFKSYNDFYGHPQGDACLCAIARTLTSGIHRPGDRAARYGGEEFAVILPNTSVMAAGQLADLMRQALADQAIEHQGNAAGVVTASIGVAAMVPQPDTEPEILIKFADKALYEAKRTGRNRVAIAGCEANKDGIWITDFPDDFQSSANPMDRPPLKQLTS